MVPLSQESEEKLTIHTPVLEVLSNPSVKPKVKRQLLQTPRGIKFLQQGLPVILLELRQTDLEQYGES